MIDPVLAPSERAIPAHRRRAAPGLLVILSLLSLAPVVRAEIEHSGGEKTSLYRSYLDFVMEGDLRGLERATELRGESAFLALEQAQLARRHGDHEALVAHAERALELNPEMLEAHELLARLYFSRFGLQRDRPVLERAMHHASEYVRLQGRDPRIHDQLARAHALAAREAEEQGRPVDAREHRRRQREVLEAWVSRTHDLRAYEALHALADETFDYEADIPHLKAHVSRLPESRRLPLLILLGQRLARLDRCEAALPVLREAAASRDLHPHEQLNVSVRLGRCAVVAGRPDVAIPALRRALELDPTNDAAAEELAEAQAAAGRAEEAMATWRAQLEEANRPARKTAVLERQARWELSRGRRSEALATARRALDLAREAELGVEEIGRLELFVARIALQRGELHEAERLARAAREKTADDDGTIFLATVLWDRGRREAALELLDAHARAQPDDAAFHGTRASWALSVRRWKSAVRHARRFLEHSRSSSRLTERDLLLRERLAASILLAAGRAEEAEEVLAGALARLPSPPDLERAFVTLLADSLVAQGRREEAVERVAAISSEDPYALADRVEWEMRHGFRDEAVEHAREALERVRGADAGPAELSRFEDLVGRALAEAGRHDEAARAFEQAVSREGHDPPQRHVALARALREEGRLQAARAAIERGRAEHPESRILRVAHGRLLLEAGEKARGAQELLSLLDERHVDADFLRRVALDLSSGGAEQAARELIDEALREAPDDPVHWLTSGTLREREGRLKAAEADLRRAIALDPGYAAAYNSLGYLLALHGRKLDEAVRLVKKALDLVPGEGSYLDSLGWALFRKGRLKEADEILTQALARNRDPVIIMHVGTLRERQGRLEEALSLYREALRLGLDEERDRVEAAVKELADESGALAARTPAEGATP